MHTHHEKEKHMDKEYWEKYYEKHNEPFKPSPFAEKVKCYLEEGKSIIDLGCGNGRDTIIFGHHLKSVGVDQCQNIVDSLNELTKDKKYLTTSFKCGDFSNLEDHDYDYAYSRFTLHSITEEQEDRVIDWVYRNVKDYFFIEVRSDQDKLVGKSTDHYRRFANMENLLTKLIVKGFKIRYAEINRNFSRYENDYNVDYNENNPMLIRIIASK